MDSSILSVFIDESGDFGEYDQKAPFYIVTMVIHNQSVDITDDIAEMSQHVSDLGYIDHAIHTGPLIRRESVYKNDDIRARKALFNSLFHFTRKLNIQYACAKIKKSECSNKIELTSKISKGLANILKNNTIFRSAKKIIIYYDNGQIELTKIITSVFSTLFSEVEFRNVKPADYRLFQVADLLCTMELIMLKGNANSLSKSETEFFGSFREFKKNLFKYIEKKRIL